MTDISLNELCDALSRIDETEAMRSVLIDLCTPAELRVLSERWRVAQMLAEGEKSYREISAETGVSTTTIGRVSRFLKDEPHGGYRLLLDARALETKI
ncbi:DNA-binding transcriptional regulator [Algimonas arctica]|uniref:DNA-binding transcriptional regulator n=1 Tax=Algimonas arctica TaxID=1479486 RepID=A0A8J3G194_9PROT|nr:YerC/YecD family TrpR-related protein [Algimonas arctica]GHA84064.1 DNA-binding transcriptional regulator [Algimonas arctica]